ncbi:MAG: hypothetical protein JO356_12925 [Acidobacteria bacterium]|nr:hypothetical protein [Acidobacteriota bacterium]
MNTQASSAVVRRPGSWKKIIATTLPAVVLLWVGLVSLMWNEMHRPPEAFARFMSHMPWQIFLVVPFETLWTRARAGGLKVGDAAPDFSLEKIDNSGSVRLSELNQNRPVVLVFGSYT